MCRLSLLALAVLGLLVTGCTDTVRMEAQRQQRTIENAAPDEVLVVATQLLRREFGRVTVDTEALTINTAPAEFTTESESGTARDLYRGTSLMRRVGTFSVGTRGGRTVAQLRIDIQREDTARQAVMHPQGYRYSDDPGSSSALDRDAATTYEQNTVWTFVRRDRTLERALLEELQERFAPADVATEEPATPPQ